MVVNSTKHKPHSDGKNKIDQYEQKLQELDKQYTSEIDGLKQQIERLMIKPKRDAYDFSTINRHRSIFNPIPFQNIHAFYRWLTLGKGVGLLTSQAPVQENGFQAIF